MQYVVQVATVIMIMIAMMLISLHKAVVILIIMMTVTHASLNKTWPSHPSWMNYNYNHIHSW